MSEESFEIAKLIESSKKIVVLSGAGISTNAGIPDFRGRDGIYTTNKYDPDKTFNISYFKRDPSYFYHFAKDLLRIIDKAQPTIAHKFFSLLSNKGFYVSIITQNIDLLHEKAGNKNIINLHGSINNWFCMDCKKMYLLNDMKEKILNEKIPKCNECSGVIRPDIVFYGEEVKDFDKAIHEVEDSDLLFVVGTSLTVYPAAFLVNYSKGKRIAVVKDLLPESHFDYFVDKDADAFFKSVSEFLNISF